MSTKLPNTASPKLSIASLASCAAPAKSPFNALEIALEKPFTLSIKFLNLAVIAPKVCSIAGNILELKNSVIGFVAFSQFLSTKFIKSLNKLDTVPNAIANASATTWFCPNTSLKALNASCTILTGILAIAKDILLIPFLALSTAPFNNLKPLVFCLVCFLDASSTDFMLSFNSANCSRISRISS